MKLGCLAAVCALAAACGGSHEITRCGNGTVDPGEQCDDGNTSNGDGCSSTCAFETDGGQLTDAGAAPDGASPDGASPMMRKLAVTWGFRTVASSTVTGTCPTDPQNATVHLLVQPAGGNMSHDTASFPCDAAGGGSAMLSPGVYDVWLEAHDSNGTVISTTLPQPVDLTTSGASRMFAFVSDGGYFVVSWKFVDANSAPKTCADVGATDVDITIGGAGGTATSAACGAGPTPIGPLLSGPYAITVQAKDSNAQPVFEPGLANSTMSNGAIVPVAVQILAP